MREKSPPGTSAATPSENKGISNQIKVAIVNRPSPMTSQVGLEFILTLAVIALYVVWDAGA
jgi:hypothetical protein